MAAALIVSAGLLIFAVALGTVSIKSGTSSSSNALGDYGGRYVQIAYGPFVVEFWFARWR